jgi:hypothetical protein
VFLKYLMPILKSELTEKLSSYSANQISLGLLVEDQLRSHDGPPLHKFIPSFHSKDLFHPSNFAKMETACMDSTVGVHPNVHIMWDFVMKRIFGGGELHVDVLKMMWSKLVEEKMLESTPERQFLALQIMMKVLTNASPLSADVVSIVFSPKICKLLVLHASDKKSMLHGVVRLTTSSIEKVFAHEDARIREVLVDHLRKSEDNLLAEMLGSIFASSKFHEMNTVPHDEYIAFLEKSLQDLGQPVPILLWFVDELYHCVTVRRSILKEDETEKLQRIVGKVLNVLWDVTVKVGTRPEIETVAKRVRNRLNSAFVTVLSSSHAKDAQASSLAFVALKTNAKAVLSQSFSDKAGVAGGDQDEDDDAEMSSSLKLLLWERFGEFCEKADKLAKRHKNVLARSFEWLFSHLILFCDDVEAEMDREDVFIMFDNMVGAYTKHVGDLKQKEKELKASAKKKKVIPVVKKAESMEDEDEPEPVDVVVDILVQCMSMSSNLLRQLSVRVFKGIANFISDESLEILAEALQPKLPEGELEEENGDENEEEDEDEEQEREDEMEIEEGEGEGEGEEGVLPFVEGEGGYDDEVELDDDEMLALDKVLAKKVRALIGGSQKGAMESKFRILDLMEVFFQENKNMRQRTLLVIPCLGSMQNVKRVIPSATDEMVLGYQQRMTKLLKRFYCKNDAEITSSLSSSPDSLEIMGSVMKDVVEFIGHAGRQYPLEAGTACLIHLMKGEISFLRTKKMPIASSSASIATLKSALVDMATRKRTHMRPDLLQNLIQRWPSLGWHLLPTIVEQLEAPKMTNFRRMQLLRVSLPLFSNSLCRDSFAEEFSVKDLLPFDALLRSFLPEPTSPSFTKKNRKAFSQLAEALLAYAPFIVSLNQTKKEEKKAVKEILSAWQEALKKLDDGVEIDHPLASLVKRVENAFLGVGDRKRRRKSHKAKKALD